MHDPVLMHFATPDPLYVKYQDLSPWSHCAANPLNIIDPSGCFVIADKWCQEGIKDGLSEEECNYVDFKENGMIDVERIQQCESTSDNFIALRTLASSDRNYIFKGAFEVQVGNDIRSMINDEESQLFGQTLMPDVDQAPSPDDNVYIYTSLTNTYLKRASNIAHEAYGHACFYELSRTDKSYDPLHRFGDPIYDKESGALLFRETNFKLKEQIDKVERRAINNYFNKILRNSKIQIY